jgi:hypothetical protein
MPIFPGLVANSGGNLPGPPTNIGLTTVNSSSLSATWTAPDYLGKHPLGNYIIGLYNNVGTLINASYATAAFPATSLTISGLSASTTYSVRISLQNSIGIVSNLSTSSPNASTSAVAPPPPPPPTPPPSPEVWYCSYNGTDGRAQTIQSSNLTDTSGCDYAVVCSTSGYPAYPSYVGCATPPPVKPPTPPPVKPPTPPPVKPPVKPPTRPPVRQCVPACPPGFFCLSGICAG